MTTNTLINDQIGPGTLTRATVTPTTPKSIVGGGLLGPFSPAYASTFTDPKIEPTVSASVIGTQPLRIPPVQTPALTAADGTLKGLASSLASAAEASTKIEDTSLSDVQNLQNQLGGQTVDQQSAEANVGLPTLNKELSDLNALQSQQLGGYLNSYNKLNQGGTGTVGGVSAAETALQRSHAIDTLLTNSLIQAKQGNITAATDSVNKAIAAKYEPIKQRLETAKFILDQVKSKASEDRKNAISAQLKIAEKNEQNEKDSQTLIINALTQEAPSDLVKKAREIAQKGGSAADVANALGVYAGDKLGRDVKLSALLTDKVQRDNIYSQIKERNETQNGGLPDKVISKITATPEYKTINGILPAIKALKDYKDSVEKYGSYENLSSEGKGTKKSTYGNAIAAWKTLAGLGALSGADFGLAENVVPAESLFTRNQVQISQLDSAILNATNQARSLTNRVSQLYPVANTLLNQQLKDIETVSGLSVDPDPLTIGTGGAGTNSNSLNLNL